MKRLVCLFLSFVFVIGLCGSFPALASSDGVSLALNPDEAIPGELMEVPIVITSNPGIISIKVQVSYDSSLFTLEEAKTGDFKGVSFGPLTQNPVTVNWMDALHPDNTTCGNLAVLVFRVNPHAPAGDTRMSVSASEKDVFNFQLQQVPVNPIADALISIEGEKPNPNPPVEPNPPVVPDVPTNTDTPSGTDVVKVGDVNGDDAINAKDALAVLKISVGKMKPTQSQQQLADVNRDNTINAKDALEILKSSVGKPSCIVK